VAGRSRGKASPQARCRATPWPDLPVTGQTRTRVSPRTGKPKIFEIIFLKYFLFFFKNLELAIVKFWIFQIFIFQNFRIFEIFKDLNF
jgi:hypothetical protein